MSDRPRLLYVVVEKTSDGGIGHVDFSRVFLSREAAEREKREIADVHREMDAAGEGWEMWSVGVHELHCYDDLTNAVPMSKGRYEVLEGAADAVVSSAIGENNRTGASKSTYQDGERYE